MLSLIILGLPFAGTRHKKTPGPNFIKAHQHTYNI